MVVNKFGNRNNRLNYFLHQNSAHKDKWSSTLSSTMLSLKNSLLFLFVTTGLGCSVGRGGGGNATHRRDHYAVESVICFVNSYPLV